MVSASRNETPAPVDVRYSVRAELESLLRSGKAYEDQEPDWSQALVKLFNPGFVKLGVAAAFVCMLALDMTIVTGGDAEAESDYDDPLVTLYSDEGEAEWSDWL